MYKKQIVENFVKKEITNLGLEEALIEISFNSEKTSFEEGYASCTPKIISGIQEGYLLNFDLKKINEQKLCDDDLFGLILHELYHLVLYEMHYVFSGERHRKKDVLKNLHPGNPIYQDGVFAYSKLIDFEDILVNYLVFRYGLYRKIDSFFYNIKHESFKNIFDYLEHEVEELTKDIKEDIQGWRIDYGL